MYRFLSRSVAVAVFGGFIATPLQAQDHSGESELAELREQVRVLTERIDELAAELTVAPPVVETGKNTVDSQKAVAPVAALSKSDGWSFKPRGRLMVDAGFTEAPASTEADDGFASEIRRARLGASGDIPGGFGYKIEIDFAGNEVELADAILSYGDGPAEVVVGHHNNFQSLEELTSSLHTTFIERAAFTDAFGFERRLGASVTFSNDLLVAQGGVFSDNLGDAPNGNYGFDGRLVVMPKFDRTQLHFGGSIHYNDIQDVDDTIRYRQRPLVHFTSERFVSTGNLEAESETGYGLEAAMISGRFHAASEAFWQEVDRPGSLSDPTFFGGYAELGVFLTDDRRGYKDGKFDRTTPRNPVGEGGFGAIQFNLRYDYLDLVDKTVVGGKQNGYLASLIWKPTDYTLFAVNYGRLEYDDAVIPTTSGDTSYGVDAFGVRAQVDF